MSAWLKGFHTCTPDTRSIHSSGFRVLGSRSRVSGFKVSIFGFSVEKQEHKTLCASRHARAPSHHTLNWDKMTLAVRHTPLCNRVCNNACSKACSAMRCPVLTSAVRMP
eukprot:3436790-Rhodomonas_salina.1